MTIDNDTKLITRAFVRAWDAADDDAKYNLVCRQVVPISAVPPVLAARCVEQLVTTHP